MIMRGVMRLQSVRRKLPKLLIIDDSEDIVEFLSDLFEDEYQCITAADGDDGVEIADKMLPDIILCDVQMPRKSGLDVVKELRNNPRTHFIPIILLSGYNTRENRLEGLRAMADDFIAKPFDYEELRLKMVNLLAIRAEIKKSESDDVLHAELGINCQLYTDEQHYFVEHMLEYFVLHYSDKLLDVKQIADHMSLSVRQLQRKIKAITTDSPMDLLRYYRLRQASQLLLRHRSIAEVAEASGFKSPNYFCTCFKDYFQETPSRYQKRK